MSLFFDCGRFLGRKRVTQRTGLRNVIRYARLDSGQMTVELAIVMPMVLVVALIVIDSMFYLVLCARFDRVAPEAVRVCAASPVREAYGERNTIAAIRTEILNSMDASSRVDVKVSAAKKASGEGLFSLIARPTEYRCELVYLPWPLDHPISIGPISTDEIGLISHQKNYAICPFRPGALF